MDTIAEDLATMEGSGMEASEGSIMAGLAITIMEDFTTDSDTIITDLGHITASTTTTTTDMRARITAATEVVSADQSISKMTTLTEPTPAVIFCKFSDKNPSKNFLISSRFRLLFKLCLRVLVLKLVSLSNCFHS